MELPKLSYNKDENGMYYMKKQYTECDTDIRIPLDGNPRYVRFICENSIRLSSTPTGNDFDERGGFLDKETGQYILIGSKKVVDSPSSACKTCLTRPRSKKDPKTWEWDGPNHVHLLVDGQWKRLVELPINLTNSPTEPRIRRKSFYGRFITLGLSL